MMQQRGMRGGVGVLCLAMGLLWSCMEPIDLERRAPARGTLGEEIHRILHKDLRRSPDRGELRGEVFWAYRDDFVLAVDTTATDALLSPLNAVMARMLPLYDNGLLPGLIRKGALLSAEVAALPEVTEALAHYSHLPSYIGQPIRARFLAHLMHFPQLRELLQLSLEMMLVHDGSGASDATLRLLTGLAQELREMTVNGDAGRMGVVLSDVLLTPSPFFAPAGPWEPLWAVRVDRRGLAQVRSGDGSVPFPFVDSDMDGLADVDGRGRFVVSGGALVLPFGPAGERLGVLERDETGRLINTTTGQMVFDYVDLHSTALGYLVREVDDIVIDDTLFELVRALRSLLGVTRQASDALGTYPSFAADGDLLGLALGFLRAMDHDDAGALLEGMSLLLKDEADLLASVVHALEVSADILDASPEVSVADDTNLVDVLLPLVAEIVATPGLLEDVLLALDAPASRELGPILADLSTRRNARITYVPGGPYDVCFHACKGAHDHGSLERLRCIQACPTEEILGTERVVWSEPETRDNLSLVHRIMALMWEASETPYGLRISEFRMGSSDFSNTARAIGDVVTFTNIGESYLHSMTGDLHFSRHVNPLVTALASPLGLDGADVVDVLLWITRNIYLIEMDPIPSTDQVTRLFNKAPLASEMPSIVMNMNLAVCKSGWDCVDAHADVLFAIEASGLSDALHPLVSAFTRHGKTELFARLLALIYTYYPSPGASYVDPFGQPLPFLKHNLRSIEPAMVALLEDGQLLDALGDLSPVMTGLRLSDGSLFLGRAGRYLHHLLTPEPGLVLVDGRAAVRDPAGEVVTPLSPFYLVLEPARRLREMLDANPAADASWTLAVDGLWDMIMQVEDHGDGVRFAKAGGPFLGALLLDALRLRWESESAAGRRVQWLEDEVQDTVVRFFSGRLFHAAVELFDWLEAQEGGLDLMREAVLHMLEVDVAGPEQVTILAFKVVTGVVDEPAWVAVARFVAQAIDPLRPWPVVGFAELPLVVHGLLAVNEILAVDPENVFIALIANGFEPFEDGTSSLGLVWDIAVATNRLVPGDAAPLSSADLRIMLETVADFLQDEGRGLERIYGIIEFALYGVAGKPAD